MINHTVTSTASNAISFVWPLFVALSGGVVVSLGVFLEVIADKSAFKNIRSYRFWGKLKHVGGWLVVIGVAIEVADAGFTAIEIKAAQTAADAANPLNQPLHNATALVHVSVELPEKKWHTNWQAVYPATLAVHDSQALTNLFRRNPPCLRLASDHKSYELWGGYGADGGGFGVFDMKVEGLSGMDTYAFKEGKSVGELAKDLQWCEFDFSGFPLRMKVSGGTVTLILNDAVTKIFNFPPQSNGDLSKGDLSIKAFATNLWMPPPKPTKE